MTDKTQPTLTSTALHKRFEISLTTFNKVWKTTEHYPAPLKIDGNKPLWSEKQIATFEKTCHKNQTTPRDAFLAANRAHENDARYGHITDSLSPLRHLFHKTLAKTNQGKRA
ncbi:hypothetical protein [Methylomonas sp. AM2-LC]|uniref:hypothetical protein n=1 Tax=Methylomonas sp. AM2-LC TaxID=3153301 RepID=UPI003263E153